MGKAIAAAKHGVKISDMPRLEGVVEALSKEEMFCRGLCKFAAQRIFAGEKSATAIAYARLADNATEWRKGYRVFSDAVLSALGRAKGMDKKAFLQEAMLVPAAITGSKDYIPSAMRLALATGLLTGALGGTGLHFLSRNARQTSEENEALLAKAMEYKKMRSEIEEDLRNAGVKTKDDEDESYRI